MRQRQLLVNSSSFPSACICSLIQTKILRQATWSRTALHISLCSLNHTQVAWTTFPSSYIDNYKRGHHKNHHVLRASLQTLQITSANTYPVASVRNSLNFSRSLPTFFTTVAWLQSEMMKFSFIETKKMKLEILIQCNMWNIMWLLTFLTFLMLICAKNLKKEEEEFFKNWT